MMKATATAIRSSVRAVAYGYSAITATARPVESVSIAKFLRVTPETPQQLVWLVPQYGVDYTVTTSHNLEWEIK